MKLRAKYPEKKHRWSLTVAWIVLMMILSLAVTVAADADLTTTVNENGLTVKSIGGTNWSGSDHGANWTGSTAVDGCNKTPASGKLELTNNSGEAKVISFDYTVSFGGGTMSINGAAVTATKGSHKQSLTNGSKVTIDVGTKADGSGTTTVTLSNIKLEVPDVTVTFNSAASGGSYTVDGAAIAASTSLTNPATKNYALVAAPAEHYVFQGWYLDGNLYYTAEVLTAAFPSGGTVTAKFVEDPLYKIATASEGTVDALVEINSRYYHDPKNSWSATQTTNLQYCYYSVAATTGTANDYDVQYVPFLDWTVSSDSIIVSKEGTAQGDYYPGGSAIVGANSWCYANMVANVIRVKAKEDCAIVFDYTNNISPTESDQPTAKPYLRIYESTSDKETIATIQSKGTLYDTASGSIDVTVAKGKYLYICMYGRAIGKEHKSSGGFGTVKYSYSGTIKNFEVAPNEQKNIQTSAFQDNTGKSLPGGKLKVNETTYTAGTDGSITPVTQPVGQAMKVSVATAPKNYKLLGWSVNGEMHYTTTYEYTLDKDTVVNPVFVPNAVTYNAAAGTYTYLDTADKSVALEGQYIARNNVAAPNATYYSSLEDAFKNNNEVILLANMTINGDYTIPAGKTLVVPRSMTGITTWNSTKSWYDSATVPEGSSVYATLTLNGNVTVNGALMADGAQLKSNGSLSGSYGVIQVNGTVTVNSGGNLYGYGVIKGSGTIYANSGAGIHETLEMLDVRHPVTLKYLADEGDSLHIFPFNSIYIYSIEAKVVYQAGADLYAHYYSEYTGQGAFHIIGEAGDDAMFRVHKNTVSKSFTDGRMLIRVDENAEVTTGSMKETMNGYFSGMSQSITVDSSLFLIPLASAYHVQIAGSFTMDHSFKLLPGAKIDILATGEVTIGASADVVAYRLNDYDYRRVYDANIPTGFSVIGYPINFSRYGSGFKINTVGSAQLNVDGILNVKGGLYVTDQLMPVTDDNKYTYYDNGYNFLTGSGTIDLSGATGTLKEIHENLTYTQTPEIKDYTVKVIPIKGLKHDATADEAAQYESLDGVMYGRINGNGLNVWTADPCQFGHTYIYEGAKPTYTWAADNSTVTAEVTCKYGDTHDKLVETVNTVLETITAPSCTAVGEGKYTATFTNAAFAEQTKTVELPVVEHTVVKDPAVSPTCTETGLTEGSHCSVCNTVLVTQQEVTALGHTVVTDAAVAPTCTTTGLTEGSHCSVCGEVLVAQKIVPAKHTYPAEGGPCSVCGKFEIYASSLRAGDSLKLYFYVQANRLTESLENYKAVITRYKEGVESGSEEILASAWTQFSESLYRFSYDGIAAKEMTDDLRVIIYKQVDGEWEEITDPVTESVTGYAVRYLKKALASAADGSKDAALRTTLVDLLCYGAAAQTEFGYYTGKLANADITDYLQYASQNVIPEKVTNTGLTYFTGATVTLKNSLIYTFYAKDTALGKTVKITYTDHYGVDHELTKTITEAVSISDGTTTYYGVQVNNLSIADGRQVITCQLMDGDTVLETVYGSVQDYAYTQLIGNATNDAELKAAVQALMNFIDSAYKYFHFDDTGAA